MEQSQALLVALDASDTVVGSYYLRPNSLCLGAHLANAGYVVAEHCRRQGIGSWAMWMPMSWCKPSSEAGPPAAANNTACDSLPTEWQATV